MEYLDEEYKRSLDYCLSQLSDERIEWLKEVALNLARNTEKYDRMSIYQDLSPMENFICSHFEADETHKITEEMHIEHIKFEERMRIRMEKERREYEEFLRETDEFIQKYRNEKASSSMIYLFPIGEA